MKRKKENFLWEHFYKEKDLSIEAPELSLYEYMMEVTKEYKNNYAINYFGKKITFKVFWDYIDKCARAFKSLGVREDDVVTICMPNTPEAAISFFAVNKIGAIVNMIHPLSAEEEIKDYLNSTKSVLLVAFNQTYSKLRNIIKDTNVYKVIFASASESMPILLNGLYNVTKGRKEEKPKNNSFYIFWKDFLHLGDYYDGNIDAHRGSEDDAVILHSGGTTGIPKSIVLSNRCFTIISKQAKICFNMLRAGDTLLSILPLFHCFGLVVGLYGPLCLGVACILVPQFDAKRFDKLLTKYKPNVLTGVPTLYEALLKNDYMKNVDMSQVKLVISGGDSLSIQKNKLVNDFLAEHNSDATITQGYGMTESTGPFCFGSLGSDKLGSVGIPLPGNIVRIIDPQTRKEVKTGETGEICLSGLSMMSRYLNNEEETKKVLELHEDGRYYIHTGDLGYIDEDGVMFYVQRMKRIIISSGYNVYPQYIESVLRDCEYIKDACVVGVPHPYKQEVAKAFIILNDGVEETYTVKKNIMDYAKKNLSHYMLPREYIYKKEFPKTKLLKTDYNALRNELIQK
ncbi:MAG: long-chain fatty acid--CoA ligase [Firmicutes bacterium]|nr:long-chain fatty acid--CoA ligase [Bacillota bacterium]